MLDQLRRHRYCRQRRQNIQRRRERQTIAFKPLAHTRATRRSLASVVQRLITASTRFQLVPIRRSRRSHTLTLQGWPDAVRVVVSTDALVLSVTHNGQWWDALLWPDCQPQKCRGGWRCALCSQNSQHSRVFRDLSDLWFEELVQPLLDYLARVPARAELQLSVLPNGGSTWAQVVAVNGVVPKGQSVVANWPIGDTP
jgi:hypothetical protein